MIDVSLNKLFVNPSGYFLREFKPCSSESAVWKHATRVRSHYWFREPLTSTPRPPGTSLVDLDALLAVPCSFRVLRENTFRTQDYRTCRQRYAGGIQSLESICWLFYPIAASTKPSYTNGFYRETSDLWPLISPINFARCLPRGAQGENPLLLFTWLKLRQRDQVRPETVWWFCATHHYHCYLLARNWVKTSRPTQPLQPTPTVIKTLKTKADVSNTRHPASQFPSQLFVYGC